MKKNLLIDSLIVIDDSGMPKAPTIRQLLDKDVRELYRRDKSKDKSKYIAECIVIYYLGDPKSPARQSGLSEPEALKMAIEQANLDKSYIPDVLVLKLIKRYYNENITEAGKVVDNILKGIHNINLSIDVMNNLLNEKLNGQITLEEAKQNLMYEKETEVSRGGGIVLSSMDADEY